MRKFCRRHRYAVGSAVVLLGVLLVIGTAGFFWASWKNRQLDTSNAELSARNKDYQREKSIAERALQDVERLSDAHLLASLLARADEDLWPAVPEKLELMRRWLVEAEALAGRAERHRFELRAVRGRALPEGEAGVSTLRRPVMSKPDYPRFKATPEDFGAAPRTGPVRSEKTPGPAARIAPATPRDWTFSSTKDAWLHWLLEDLVTGLDDFCDETSGTLASVRQRRAWAMSLHERSVAQHEVAWQRTIDGIHRGDRYPGLRQLGFEPQLGLVPLGPDPDSGLFEFLDLATHSGPILERDAEGRLRLTDETGIVLVMIPGGSFLMGAQNQDENAPNYDGLASANERPVHQEEVEAYLLGKFELTQAQWMRVEGGTNPSYFYAGGWAGNKLVTPRHPVEQVQWSKGYRMLRKTGLRYPTEAEWEYATRAGTGTMWFFGTDGPKLASVANFADQSAKGVTMRVSNLDDGFSYTAPIGSFDPNPMGLHDVYGNVAEWCSDLWRPHYGTQRALNEPLAKSEIRDSRRRVVRGGSFNLLPDHARSGRRHAVRGNSILGSVGVRPARTIRRSR